MGTFDHNGKAPDPLRNSKDPLRQIHASGDAGHELLRRFVATAEQGGFSREAVVNASISLILSCIRQRCPTATEAEAVYNELMGKAKTLLLEQHYNSLSNKRKNVFPSHQTLGVPLMHLGTKFHKT